MTGKPGFNEVVFADAFVPDDHVMGEIDGASKQATSELEVWKQDTTGRFQLLKVCTSDLPLVRRSRPEDQ